LSEVSTGGASGQSNPAVPSTDAVKLFEHYVSSLAADSAPIQATSATSEPAETTSSQWDQRKVALLTEGIPLLNRIIDTTPSLHRLRAAESAVDVKDVVFKKITLRDFGPYGGKPVTYPLDKRGMVLIQGLVDDETGADSNGSGKVSTPFHCISHYFT